MIACCPHVFHLILVHTEDKNILVSYRFVDFHVSTVHCTKGNSTVNHQLHVTCTTGFFSRQRNLFTDFTGRDNYLCQGNVVVFHKDYIQLFGNLWVLLNFCAKIMNQLHNSLCMIVAGSRFRTKQEGLGLHLHIGIIQQIQVQSDNTQCI